MTVRFKKRKGAILLGELSGRLSRQGDGVTAVCSVRPLSLATEDSVGKVSRSSGGCLDRCSPEECFRTLNLTVSRPWMGPWRKPPSAMSGEGRCTASLGAKWQARSLALRFDSVFCPAPPVWRSLKAAWCSFSLRGNHLVTPRSSPRRTHSQGILRRRQR